MGNFNSILQRFWTMRAKSTVIICLALAVITVLDLAAASPAKIAIIDDGSAPALNNQTLLSVNPGVCDEEDQDVEGRCMTIDSAWSGHIAGRFHLYPRVTRSTWCIYVTLDQPFTTIQVPNGEVQHQWCKPNTMPAQCRICCRGNCYCNKGQNFDLNFIISYSGKQPTEARIHRDGGMCWC